MSEFDLTAPPVTHSATEVTGNLSCDPPVKAELKDVRKSTDNGNSYTATLQTDTDTITTTFNF